MHPFNFVFSTVLTCALGGLSSHVVHAQTRTPAAPVCSPTASEEPLTLDKAVELTLCQHPDIRAANARSDAAHAVYKQTSAALLPSLSLGVTTTGAVKEQGGTATTTNASIRASHTLFDFGRRAHATEAARLTSLASELDADAALRTLLLSTAEKYFQTVQSQLQLQAAVAQVSSAKSLEQAVQARYTAGVVPKVEWLQARAHTASSQVNLVRAQAAAKKDISQLASHMGMPIESSITLAAQTPPELTRVPDIPTLIHMAHHNLPELFAAQTRLDSAKAQVKSAAALGKPIVTLNAALQRNVTPSTTSIPSTVNRSIGLQLDVPIYQGGLSTYHQKQAHANVALAETDLEAKRRAAELAVITAYSQFEGLDAAYTGTQQLVHTAQEVHAQAKGRYLAGVGTLTDWVEAQSKLVVAEQQHATNLAQWHLARLTLAKVIGTLNHVIH